MTFIIAEIGINHNGSIELAKKLIDAAKWSGADAVKFQKRTVEVVVPVSERSKPRKTPWGEISYFDYKNKIEFGKDEYDEIDAHCRKLDIPWFASAWDSQAQDFLKQYNLTWNKIASAMATNLPFVRQVGLEHKWVFLSTGMCTLPEIAAAVLVLQELACNVTLMHTVSTYPADENTLNLACIKTLKERFNLPVGYSGHEPSVSPSVIAVALGAVAVERHLTLDRSMFGTDQAASLEPIAFYNMVNQIRKIPKIVGDGQKRILPAEAEVAKKLRYWL